MRKLFLLVSAVVLVDTAFFAAIAPLLPKYAADLDLSKSAAGLLTASYAAGTLVGSLPAGWLAVRFGVKPTLLTGLVLLAITSLAFGFANHVVLLDSARFVQGIGGACSWAAGMAWLVGAAPPGRRGELLGAGLSAAIVGVLLGPVLGGAATVVTPEVVFSGVAAVAIGLAAVAWTMPAVAPGEETSVLAAVTALRRPAVAAAFGLFMLPALFSGVLDVLAPLRLSHLGASGVAVGAIFLVAAAFEAVVSPVSGRLSDQRGRLAPMRIGLAGAAILGVLLPLPSQVLLSAALLVLVVMALGTFWAPAMAMLSDASDAVGLDQGLAFALANLAWAGGHVIGGAGGARLADATSDAVPYGLMAGICALTLAAVLTRRTPRAAVGSSPGSQ
ncbi:MAG TPA: MFS transporter [Thermoleophilaceae bacterium]